MSSLFKILDLTGLDPRNISLFATIKSLVTIVAAFLLIITSVTGMGCAEWNVDTIVPIVEGFVAALQVKLYLKLFVIVPHNIVF